MTDAKLVAILPLVDLDVGDASAAANEISYRRTRAAEKAQSLFPDNVVVKGFGLKDGKAYSVAEVWTKAPSPQDRAAVASLSEAQAAAKGAPKWCPGPFIDLAGKKLDWRAFAEAPATKSG